ncbi:MAG TPA: squalene/phytoene synthase family protein [candidate division Zixibacteria bacterium]|nr:squalene/phytoene synthase family protein [candidate division Zixibacteria bacterium]
MDKGVFASNDAQDLYYTKVLDNPNLDIAARFWERERYNAFRVCCRSMRYLDDLVDSYRVSDRYGNERIATAIDSELTAFLQGINGVVPADGQFHDLIEIMTRFALPLWPWSRLVQAKRHDIRHCSFPRFIDFLRYCEGAAVAPAAVFIHLCGVKFVDGN